MDIAFKEFVIVLKKRFEKNKTKQLFLFIFFFLFFVLSKDIVNIEEAGLFFFLIILFFILYFKLYLLFYFVIKQDLSLLTKNEIFKKTLLLIFYGVSIFVISTFSWVRENIDPTSLGSLVVLLAFWLFKLSKETVGFFAIVCLIITALLSIFSLEIGAEKTAILAYFFMAFFTLKGIIDLRNSKEEI